MLNILIFAVIVTAVVMITSRYKKMDTTEQRATLWRLGTGIFLGLLVVLVITGRLHWVGAAIGALLPFLRIAANVLMQALPFWLSRRKEQTQENTQASPSTSVMTPQEAMEILGLTGDLHSGQVTQESVLDAHRRLIQKVHPDRGGNDYLAAKINQARDVLLKSLSR